MLRIRLLFLLATILLLPFTAGCGRSPEARRDKFLARGKELINKKDYSRAMLEFQNAARATPKDAEPYFQIGTALVAAGDLRAAVVAFKQALDRNPKHTGAQLGIAQLMTVAGSEPLLKDALARLTELSAAAPDNREVLNTLALTELKL